MWTSKQALSQKQSGHWLVLAAAVLWGTTGTAQALAPPTAEPVGVGAVRLAIGGAALLILALTRGALQPGGRWPVLPTAFAAGSMAVYQLCFFAAVARTGVAVGTIVAIGSAPILAGFLGLIVRGERSSLRWLVATVLAIMGCSLLAIAGSSVTIDLGGIVLALGAGAAYAVYTLASKNLVTLHPPDAVTAVVFCLGALFLSPLLFTSDLSWLAQPRGVAVALHLGLVATAASYGLFVRGLMQVPTATAVTLSLAEPLTAGALGVLLLGEQLTSVAGLGTVLLFAGLALLSSGPQVEV
jgi:DME family drug/metabolite transporter